MLQLCTRHVHEFAAVQAKAQRIEIADLRAVNQKLHEDLADLVRHPASESSLTP